MKGLMFLVLSLFSTVAFAGFQGFNGTTDLKVFNSIKCSSGLTCSKVGDKFQIVAGSSSSTLFTNYGRSLDSLTGGTSTTPSATTVYLSQVLVSAPTTLTGIKINSAATVGTNKYLVALFDSTGAVVATSALAGVITANANAYQTIAFTAPVAVVGPASYWIGLYLNGTTDRFYSLPASKAPGGLAGSIAAQTFGTVVAITPPTTFTADVGPVAYTY